MRLIRWSVDHPQAVLALYAALLAVAALTLGYRIPLRLAPSIESPLVAVVTEVMDMPAAEVEARVTTPLERGLAGVGSVRQVRSTSMRGMSVITLEFPYAHDMRTAMEQTTAATAALSDGLDVRPWTRLGPRVRRVDPLDIPVLRLGVTAPTWSAEALRTFLDTEVRARLQQVPGVREVYAFGGGRRPLMIMVDRGALDARGLSMVDARDALEAAGMPGGAGQLRDPASGIVDVSVAAPLRAPDDLARIALRSADGRTCRLGDVASFSEAEATSHYRCNGHPAIELNVTQQGDASSPVTIARVGQALAELEAANPGVRFERAYDNAHFVAMVGRNVWQELALAVALTGFVVWLFLGDLRGTLVALATVPTSLACAVILFVPLGLSLNSSTLVGLLLAIGRIVDDTIIDLHAVQRHLQQGKDARTAAIDGCTEVRRAVIGATVVICLAMLPLTFAGGLTQDMFVGIVWPFLLSLAASLGVSLTLTPVLAAWCWRGVPPRERTGPAQRLLECLEGGYTRGLARALSHRGLVMCGAFAACYLSWTLWPLVGAEMMPLSDTGQIYCVLEARPGSSLEETRRMAVMLEELLRKQPEVVRTSVEIGPAEDGGAVTGYAGRGGTTATMLVTLTDKDARRRSIWDIADGVWTEAMATIPHVRRLSLKEMGSDVMASAMAPVELVIHGPDPTRLAWLAEQTQVLADALPSGGLRQTAVAWSMQPSSVRLRFDRAALQAAGLTEPAATEQAMLALGGGAARVRMADGRPIMLAYAEEQRRAISDLGKVSVRVPNGRVPLAQLAVAESAALPEMIDHDNLRRSNSVMGSYRNGGPGSMQLGMDLLMASRMRFSYPPGYDIEQRGDMTQMMDAFGRLLWGLVASLVLMYVALAVQFRSLVAPLAVMAAIPLELPGVLLALLVAGQTLSTVSLLGLVVLNGMDVTASILLLDAVVARRALGASTRTAIEAAAPTRLRPVLMTVFVTLAVMAPLALAPRTGMDAYAPLATVVAGGLAMSTLLTLGIVPVLYSLLQRSERRAGITAGDAN